MLSAEFGKNNSVSNSSINIPEYIIMKKIADNPNDSNNNVTLLDIREYLSVSKAAVSQILKSLENKGFIKR